jgi:hypothetical protein
VFERRGIERGREKPGGFSLLRKVHENPKVFVRAPKGRVRFLSSGTKNTLWRVFLTERSERERVKHECE